MRAAISDASKLFVDATQSQNYSRYRPGYPISMLKYLIRDLPSHRLAWDAGCGSGQASALLSSLNEFQTIIATDVSRSQIACAPQLRNVVWGVTSPDTTLTELEELVRDSHPDGIAGKVDFVMVAQALHWFNIPVFHSLVKSLLTNGGVYGAWCYSLVRMVQPGDVLNNLASSPELTRAKALEDQLNAQGPALFQTMPFSSEFDATLLQLYEGVLGPYWHPNRALIEQNYDSIDMSSFSPMAPRDNSTSHPSWFTVVEWTQSDFDGYLDSWSSLTEFRKVCGHDPRSDEFRHSLTNLFAGESRLFVFPIALKCGRAIKQ